MAFENDTTNSLDICKFADFLPETDGYATITFYLQYIEPVACLLFNSGIAV